MERVTTRLLAVLAGVVLLMGLTGCGGGEKQVDPESRKLLIIGIDSADWNLLEPMMSEGRLPHMKAFRDQSTYGRMHTFYPLQKSPVLWASITTGVQPEVHGIHNFVRGRDAKPVTSSAWYAPAIWDIAGAAGLRSTVVGMWTTYPARDINGVMVSDYLPYGRRRARPLAHLVSPDSLTEAVVALRVDPDSLTASDLGRFVDASRVPELDRKYPRQMAQLRSIYAADLGYLAVSRMLARRGDNDDLFFFYMRGPDMISHDFYKYLRPEHYNGRIDPDELSAFKDVVKKYYDWTDEVVGEVLSWFPPDRQTVMVSDHGFYGPRPDGNKGTHEHSEWGIFLVRSPLYEAGHKFGHLELLDICPTMLTLLDVPPAGDMPGHVLREGLTEKGKRRVAHLEKKKVASYMPLRPAAGPQAEQDPRVDEEIRRQLRSLGYIK